MTTRLSKLIVLIIAAAMLLCMGPVFAGEAESASETEIPVIPKDLPDFSVTTLDGETFTLSKALEEKKAVVINIFKVDCPYCRNEFPLFNEAIKNYADAAFIGLDTNNFDTAEYITEMKQEEGIEMPLASIDDETIFGNHIPYEGYPCTLIIDRFGKLVFFQDYGLNSEPERLTDALDAILAEDYQGGYEQIHQYDVEYADMLAQMMAEDAGESEEQGYLLIVVDQDSNPVPGAFVNFCSEAQETCRMDQTDEDGEIFFEVPADRYHIQFLSLPDGYSVDPSLEMYTEDNYGDPVVLEVTKN